MESPTPEDAYRRIANGCLRLSCLRNAGALAIEAEDLLRSLLVPLRSLQSVFVRSGVASGGCPRRFRANAVTLHGPRLMLHVIYWAGGTGTGRESFEISAFS